MNRKLAGHSSRVIFSFAVFLILLGVFLKYSPAVFSFTNASFTWDSFGGGSWTTTTNWNPNGFPNGIGDTANFGNKITSASQVTIPDATNITVGSIFLDDNDSYIINSTGPNNTGALTLDASSGNATITKSAVGGGNHQVAANITLNDDLTITSNVPADSSILTIFSNISGAGRSVVKAGTGNVVFSPGGTNSYTGSTSVNAGKLTVNRVNGPSAFSIAPTGILTGTGTIGALTTTGGTVSPGDSVGVLNANGNVFLNNSTTFKVLLNGTTAGQFGQLNVTGTVDLGGSALNVGIVPFPGTYNPAINDSFVIINNDASDLITTRFAGLPNSGNTFPVGAATFSINYAGGSNGNDVVITVVPTPPTAAHVGVAGRVVTSSGAGLGNARVTLTGANNNPVTTITNSFGYFRFDSVEAGSSYVIGVTAKRYHFDSKLIALEDEVTDLVFTPSP
ncbi:MAG TPA: carboxypeptidase-like regulatory domain-containing protein [Pyrinomonadaceae bacterium]|jgi:autotransporter-associated beta strand protein|nr:carboxypeptidase-like regulatory domain-containing protein [Pyrinomonadaceae bacterium]